MKVEQARNQRGQILVGVIVIMLMLAIIVPVMVTYVQNEARWSLKQDRNTTAFQLGEAGIDRGMRKISESTTTWYNGQDGIFPAGYLLNQSYSDLTGGCYAVSISSGPEDEQVTIISVGIHNKLGEQRAVKAVFATQVTDVVVYGKGTVAFTGNNFQTEWGAVVTPKAITVGARLHPQYYSSGAIDLDANGSSPPNCDAPDCIFWYSYDPNIPLQPDVDFDFYRSSAQGSGAIGPSPEVIDATIAPTQGTYWGNPADTVEFGNVLSQKGRTIFIEGNMHITSSGGNHHIIGNLLVMGNLTTSNGNIGNGTEILPVPRKAWKQYGKDWAFYKATYDPSAPATFPGLSSGYLSPATLTYEVDSKVFVHGFLYVGGNFDTGSGGGNFALVGSAFVNGNTVIATNSQGRLYYNAEIGESVRSTTIVLQRLSWMDYPAAKWPGLTCN